MKTLVKKISKYSSGIPALNSHQANKPKCSIILVIMLLGLVEDQMTYFLHSQSVYQCKAEQCQAKYSFPKDLFPTKKGNWSTEQSMMHYIETYTDKAQNDSDM